MLAKVIYLGYHPLGDDLEIEGIKIMQHKWKVLHRPMVFAFGKSIKGANPTFSYTFVVKEKEKMVFFIADETEIGKYHIWGFSVKISERLRNYTKIKMK